MAVTAAGGTEVRERGITFAVHDVEPASDLMPVCKAYIAFQKLIKNESQALVQIGAPTFAVSEKDTNPFIESCSDYHSDVVEGVATHPLMSAVHCAFSQHRPLVLSPDVIWTTIAQGFAQHINTDPEKYRSLFVEHSGKIELQVRREDFVPGSPENLWEEIFEQFTEKIAEHVGEETCALLRNDFSTTGPVEFAVSHIVMMETFKAYFDYVLMCICGIPSITLEGSTDDWLKVRDKAEKIVGYDLAWWGEQLIPICDHFVRASKGDIDLYHWQNIYKRQEAYGTEICNGWFPRLIPYLEDDNGRVCRRNPLLEEPLPMKPKPGVPIPKESRFEYLKRKFRRFTEPRKDEEQFTGIRSSEFPSGLSMVPLTLRDLQGNEKAMEIIGGIMAIHQDPKTMALIPKAGWAVREDELLAQMILRLKKKSEIVPATGEQAYVSSARSAELVRFQEQFKHENVILRQKGGTYRIPTPWYRQAQEGNNAACVMEYTAFCELDDGSRYCQVYESGIGQDPRWMFVHMPADRQSDQACTVVARSLGELLKHMLEDARYPFHVSPEFEGHGTYSFPSRPD